MPHKFDNIKFNDKQYNSTVTKWKDFEERIYELVEKTVVMEKFRQNYRLKGADEDDNTSKVYAPTATTELLNINNPKHMKAAQNKGVNEAQSP